MSPGKIGYRAWISWLSLALLVVLVCILGGLQYRWIGEISETEQRKLQDYLQTSLLAVSRDFNTELSTACAALLPSDPEVTQIGREQAYERRYAQWRDTTNHAKLFSRIGVVWNEKDRVELRMLNLENGTLSAGEWPEAWSAMKERILARINQARVNREPGGPGERMEEASLIDLPRFGDSDRGGFQGGFGSRGERDWLLAEVNPGYFASALLPDLLARHFGANYQTEYQVEVFARNDPAAAIYPPGPSQRMLHSDASTALFEVGPQVGRGGWARNRGRGPNPGRGFGPGEFGRGRWQMAVSLKAGSLETVVARARRRNLGISAGLLLLLLATGGALVRFSRQTQRLAEVEMEFVAGVSHELRTPLTVIRTAAFNLRGKLSANPSQVERYGVLIQQESEKLTAIVEQVLRFASAKRGHVIREREPLSIESLLEDSLISSRDVLEEALCQIEKRIEPGLPLVAGDSTALRQAFQNLINNAVKYGTERNRWIGIFARTIAGLSGPEVEVRISDRGPGIPLDEQKHVFDAFFRGKRAISDQIHGTGLGLNLVKKIVEAHGGTVSLESDPAQETSFVVRIPTLPAEHQDELAHSLG